MKVTELNLKITSVDRHKTLSRKELINEYVKPGKPVILTEAAMPWKAMKKWTPEFFKTKYGNIEREVKGKKYKIAEQIDMIFQATDENPAPYPFNFNVQRYFPELLEDINPTLLYGETDRIAHPLLPKFMLMHTHLHELFFGGKGSFFPLHFDELYLHTQITQIYGDKEFFLFPPEQTEFLYPEDENSKLSKVKNIFSYNEEKFPLFKNANPIVAMVHQGESIFFPSPWWHTTRMPGPSISYGRAILNAYNWDYFLKDFLNASKKSNPFKSRFFYNYGKVLDMLMNIQEPSF